MTAAPLPTNAEPVTARTATRPPALATWSLAAAGIMLAHAQFRRVLPAGWDATSVGMAILAAACAVRTWRLQPARGSPGVWRWRLVVVGCVLWAMQWFANSVPEGSLLIDQAVSKLLASVRQIAFTIALFPLPAGRDDRRFLWLDAAQGFAYALLLTPLAWPHILSIAPTDPNRAYLYINLVAMAVLAAISFAVQTEEPLRGLYRALFATLGAYALVRIATREIVEGGWLPVDSSAFLIGDLVFVIYLATIGAAHGAHRLGSRPRIVLSGRLVPLALTAMIVSLSFSVALVLPRAGVAAAAIGVLSLIIYASRTTLSEDVYRQLQRESLDRERRRSSTIIDLMHEVRSPLGAVSLNAQLILRTAEPDCEQASLAQAINTGCSAIARVLDDTLMLERLEAGLLSSNAAPCDCRSLVRVVVDMLEQDAHDFGVKLTSSGPSLTANLDEASCQRILINLVYNALRFTPAGGQVDLTVERHGDHLGFEVTDTGVGIEPRIMSRLFERFGPVGRPIHGRHGTGLGLSISMALARSMNGSIEVASVLEQGSRFKLIVPLHLCSNEQALASGRVDGFASPSAAGGANDLPRFDNQTV